MRLFLTKLLLFALMTLLLATAMDFLLSRQLAKTKGYPGEFEVMEDIYSCEILCDVAIYGSSRAWNHIDPSILNDSTGLTFYNFGVNGQNFVIQHLRHREYLKRYEWPKRIIVSLDIFMFQPKNEMYYMMQFYPYMLWNANIYAHIKNYVGFNAAGFAIPLLRYSGKRKALTHVVNNIMCRSEERPARLFGFGGLTDSWNTDLEDAMAQRSHYTVLIDTAVVELFEAFLSECSDHGTEVLLVYSPEHIDGQRYVSNRELIFQLYTTLAKDFNLPLLDYSNDSICLDRSQFLNSSHLNASGAERFSRKFAHDIKPFLQSRDTGDPEW